MPIIKRSGASSQIDQKLKSKRQQIIEEDRIRVLRESLILFYDKLMEKYELIYARTEESELEDAEDDSVDKEICLVNREEVEAFAGEYADTKPTGF